MGITDSGTSHTVTSTLGEGASGVLKEWSHG